MPTASDITTTPVSNLLHIDALLDVGPDWNYLTPAGNTITYTFSTSSGNEVVNKVPVTGQQAFSATQQANARTAMQYIAELTGIVFTESVDGASAQVHLCNLDLVEPGTTGLCSWSSSFLKDATSNALLSYSANAYVYLDNREWASQNANLSPGSTGYETLLHELGHMLGLKHPFEDTITLPLSQNNTSFTLMAYNPAGGPYASFSPYDVAALDWLYGGDGLGGALGVNSVTGARYITGSAAAETLTGTDFNDTLRGNGGNDMLNGGAGNDTAIFSGSRTSYTFTESGDWLTTTGPDGSDTLSSVELFQFDEGTFQRAQVVDTTPPAAPTQNVSKNAAGYVVGNAPELVGIAEAGATIRVFSGGNLVGTTIVDANGFYRVQLIPLGDGVGYTIFSTATDASGNTSAPSVNLSFNVDATPPAAPTATMTPAGSNNQPVFTGTGEVGSTISLVQGGNLVIGQATVGAGGTWSITPNPIVNGAYNIVVQATDIADNPTNAASTLAFNVSSALNRTGTAGNDTLTTSAGNNAVDGLGGIDTAVFSGARGAHTVAKVANGFTVNGADGFDALYGVERLHFADASVAIDISGNGGQAYRLYSAAFNRTPDLPGVGFWMTMMDRGVSLSAAANGFINSAEFQSLYGANPTTTEFVDKLYLNVLHRPLDQAGFEFWVKAIDQLGVARADILAAFSESAENQAQVIGTIQNGFEFIPFA